ncbi:ABC-2 type transport system permease protein [Natronincola peptidivorans]|uniref:ABC-2 type transport system permease protein n=1 Tax=Natronincola peptidivorans TaxID=426128 RepID=A0A1I0CF81_9FIRM|nr:DUF6449 domain-containing protein [Natronincola peptidivorans]SET17721.1 ABC-2 type transport system permease protein [Natronincola peptidivorans]
MTLKASLFSKGLIFSNFKRFWWVSAVYGLLLFFMLPLRHMMIKNAIHDEWIKHQLGNSLDLAANPNNFQLILILLIPVVMAALVFRYMQQSDVAAMMHSLPYNRKVLYCSHTIAGLLLLLLPIIMTSIILMILQVITNLSEYYSFINIIQWLGYTSLFLVMFFSIAVFVGMFTGNSIAQMAFTYILHMLPAGFFILLHFNIRNLLYGYGHNSVLASKIENHLPLFVLLNGRINGDYISIGTIIAYAITAILCFIGAYLAYKGRNAEAAGDVIAFKVVRPIFKYGVTVCSMLLGGIYFTSIAGVSIFTTLFGYLFSSFLGYWIAEMIMEKSFKVWGAYKGYIAYTVIVLMLVTAINVDAIGYVDRIPKAEDVEQVYLGSYYGWTRLEAREDKDTPISMDGYVFKQEVNIENMIKLHESLIEGPERPEDMVGIYRYQHIIYSLKNGKHIIREYPINEERYAAALKSLYESKEYKEKRFPIIHQRAEEIERIEITDPRSAKKSVVLYDPIKIQEFTMHLRKDVEGVAFEELIKPLEGHPMAILTDTDGNRINYALRQSYNSVFQWLKKHGHYENVILLPEDVEYIVLERLGDTAAAERVEIRNFDIIKELLEITTYSNRYPNSTILVGFYITGHSGTSYYLGHLYEDTAVSDELRHYIEQLPPQ